MSYQTWQDLLDEEDGTEQSPDSQGPADGSAPLGQAPGLESIAAEVPGLADLLTERKGLERKMQALLGGQDPDADEDPREAARFPVLQHTPESRMLDRRMHQMEVDNRLGRLKQLAKRGRLREQESVQEDQRRRHLAKRSADRKRARREDAERQERSRRALDRERIEARWRTGKEVAKKAKAVRGALERGRLETLDQQRLGAQADAIRARFADAARSGSLPPLGLPMSELELPTAGSRGGLQRRRAPKNEHETLEFRRERQRFRALDLLHKAREEERLWGMLRERTAGSAMGKLALDGVEAGLDLDKRNQRRKRGGAGQTRGPGGSVEPRQSTGDLSVDEPKRERTMVDANRDGREQMDPARKWNELVDTFSSIGGLLGLDDDDDGMSTDAGLGGLMDTVGKDPSSLMDTAGKDPSGLMDVDPDAARDQRRDQRRGGSGFDKLMQI